MNGAIKIEEVLEKICKYYKISREEIVKGSRKDIKKIAVYIMKKKTNATNRQIGKLLGNMSYSAVSKSRERFEKEIKGNIEMEKEIKKIEEEMSHVKC